MNSFFYSFFLFLFRRRRHDFGGTFCTCTTPPKQKAFWMSASSRLLKNKTRCNAAVLAAAKRLFQRSSLFSSHHHHHQYCHRKVLSEVSKFCTNNGSVGNKNNTFFTHQKHRLGKRTMTTSSNNNNNNSNNKGKHGATKTMQSFSGPPQKVVARPGVVAADGMPRYPNLTIPGMLRGSDYVGTASFALTGTLLAASKGLDCFGAPVIGLITAVGGGTIRDFVLGAGRRAFWMEEQEYVYIALATGVATFFGWEYAKKHFEEVRDDAWWIEASDALGVGAFCVIGCMNGVRAGVSAINCIACGVFTATGGGVVRDVIVGRPPRIFHSYATAYATPAAAGAATYLLARKMGVSTSARIVSGVTVGILGRVASESGNVRLPLYESQEAKANAKMKGDNRE